MSRNAADIIWHRRTELGLSQTDLAKSVGVDRRQIRRYEAGESQPTLGVARNLARALEITIDELAGGSPGLSGRWYTSWHLSDSETRHGVVQFTHQRNHVDVSPVRPDKTEGEKSDPDHGGKDGLAWQGGLRVDDDGLFGWFSIDTSAISSRGAMLLERHGETMITGTWFSTDAEGLTTGSLGLGRQPDDALAALGMTLTKAAKSSTTDFDGEHPTAT